MIEKEFVKQNINKVKLAEYLDNELERANYSHIDFTKTSTSTNIVLYSEKPGLIIGRGGHRIKELIQKLKDDFGIENPQVEAKEVEKPDLDAEVVAKNVVGWLEKGGHPKRVGNTYVRRVMQSGAAGVQIEISGKLGGSRGRVAKFSRGYVKKCGNTAKENIDYAYRPAVTKPGALGVKIRIMKEIPPYMKRQQVQKEEPEEVIEEDSAKKEAEQEEAEMEEQEAEEKGGKQDDEARTGTKQHEEKVEEESDSEIDMEETVKMNISEIKDKVKDKDIDFEKLLEAEKENKDRKTLKKWLKKRIE